MTELYVGNKKYSILQKQQINNQDINITENGNYVCDSEHSGFGVVRVQVPEAILDSLTVNPSIQSQTLVPTGLVDGFNEVIVNPVTSSIDANIQAGNIKKDVTILGTTGTLEFTTEDLTVNPSTLIQTFTPTEDGYSRVTVNAVTNNIDANIISANIKQGVTILGVVGSCIESREKTRNITENGLYTAPSGYTGFSEVDVDVPANQTALTITPTTSQQTYTAPDQYSGFTPVVVNGVTHDIDANITPANIKKDVTILGVTGNFVVQNSTLNITPTTSAQTFTASQDEGFSPVHVAAVDNTIDNNIVPGNIKSGVSILGITGSCVELKGQTKTGANKITTNGTFTPDTGYNGFTEIEVDVDSVRNQDLLITTNGVYTADTGYTGLGRVEVDINTVNNTNLTATPSTTQQVFTPASPYTGYGKVTINPAPTQSKTFTASAGMSTTTTITPDNGYVGLNQVTIDLSWIESQLQALNAGDAETTPELQDITVTQAGTYTAGSGYDGLGTVTVNLDWVDLAIASVASNYTNTTVDGILENSLSQLNTDALSLRDYACYGMSLLEEVNLTSCESIGSNVFVNTSLETLTISTPTMCTLADTTLPGSIQHIYVPSNLVSTYKGATNWQTYSSLISAIS